MSTPTAPQLLLTALDQGQTPTLHVTSDSMSPLLRAGDQIRIASLAPGQPKPGDIILCGPVADLLVHRYWRQVDIAGQSHLITRGDRLTYFDPPVPVDKLRGIVISRRRDGRRLDLSGGPGAWLNRRLAQLSAIEAKVIGLDRPGPTPLDRPAPSPAVIRRLIKRTLVASAVLLTGLVGRLASSRST